MRTSRPILITLILAIALLPGTRLDAQVTDLVKRVVKSEIERKIERLLRDAVRCALLDDACWQRARDEGKEVIYVDASGEVITDDDGVPVTDRDEAAKRAGPGDAAATAADAPAAGERPGTGAWANYDFVPGETVLLYEDFSDDNVGDFPRRFELIQGSFDVIEWQDARYMRALSNGSFAIALPETLPEKFTLESSVSVQHGNGYLRVTPARAYQSRQRPHRGSVVSMEYAEAGMEAVGDGPQVMTRHDQVTRDAVVPFRVMADGTHMKVYLGDRRVANVPNAIFPRGDTLFFAVSSASEDKPILIGPVRIAAGDVDLYDRLARDGRVATRGILFDVNSDVIRPESTPTLKEIGAMLQEHADLRISIEGHTDSDGDDALNQDLSERRAAAVKAFLVEEYDVDGARLETAGMGESSPVAPNDTPEGKQQNRRVELVRIGG